MNIHSYLARESARIDKALETFLPRPSPRSSALHQAMRYAVFPAGKRIRPVLALEACRAVGGDVKKAMPAACALELIHSYSLVHDDLPCMDDDPRRRGQPSCHVKFGEDTALLAGDALLTLAFRALCVRDGASSRRELAGRLDVARLIAEAVGSEGMVGGQAVDIACRDQEVDLATAEYINVHKSGALIAVSLKTGATLGGGSKKQVESLYRYGKFVGLLFQIVDDIMDRQGYAKVIGVSEARKEAGSLLGRAKAELAPLGPRGRTLAALADFVMTRSR
ncbi:MAG: polyprenyl synthetase family protein [Candidatus Omnitrophica bacterium]|nr:polyprenyl synthetase family protein [Candidatus Omnitrophota bacterium]